MPLSNHAEGDHRTNGSGVGIICTFPDDLYSLVNLVSEDADLAAIIVIWKPSFRTNARVSFPRLTTLCMLLSCLLLRGGGTRAAVVEILSTSVNYDTVASEFKNELNVAK